MTIYHHAKSVCLLKEAFQKKRMTYELGHDELFLLPKLATRWIKYHPLRGVSLPSCQAVHGHNWNPLGKIQFLENLRIFIRTNKFKYLNLMDWNWDTPVCIISLNLSSHETLFLTPNEKKVGAGCWVLNFPMKIELTLQSKYFYWFETKFG